MSDESFQNYDVVCVVNSIQGAAVAKVDINTRGYDM